MRLGFVSFRITCKRLLRDRAFIGVLLLLPLCLLFCCRLIGGGTPVVQLRAGVLFSPEDPVASHIYDTLPNYPFILFEAYAPEDQPEVEYLVRTGRLDCAYILDDGLTVAVTGSQLEESVTILESPGTVSAPVLNELIYAAILETAAREFTVRQIGSVFGHPEDTIRGYVDARLDFYKSADSGMFVYSNTGYVSAVREESAGEHPMAARILHGIPALFLMALTLFLLPRFISQKTGELGRRLDMGGLACYYGGMGAALLLLNLLVGALALWVVSYAYPAVLCSVGWEAAMLSAYCLFLTGLGILLAAILKTPDLLMAASIYLILLTLVLGGVLLDWTELGTPLAFLSRLFPTQWYLAGVQGQDAACLALLLGGSGVSLLLTVMALGFHRVRSR